MSNDTFESVFNENEVQPLDKGLNILTILTLIACGLGLIGSIFSYTQAENTYQTVRDMQGKEVRGPAFLKAMTGPEAVYTAKKMMEQKVPYLIMSLVALTFCTVGALQMRKQRKKGYYLWLIGEIIPLIGIFVLIGAQEYNGIGGILKLLFPAIFIILYTVYKKYLYF